MRCPRKDGRFFFHLAKASAFSGVLLGIAFVVFAQTVQEPVPDSFDSFLQSLTTPLEPSSVGTASFSVSGAGAQPNFVYRQITNAPPPKVSAGRAISADGRYVALYSTGDLVPFGNTDGNFEVFRFDAQTGQMTQVTNTAFDSANPTIRADGSQIAFVSTADLVPGRNTDHSAEIFLFDQFSGFQQLTDTDSTRFSTSPSMSADGLRIVFESTGNLDSNPLNRNNAEGVTEVFLYDALSGNIEQLTNSDNPALDNAVTPRISADGSRVVFLSGSDNLIFNPEHSTEVVRVDLATVPRQFVPITGGDFCPSGNPIAPCFATEPSISSDGRRVAFVSNANLQSTVGNSDGSRELFLWDQTPPPNTPVIRQVTNLPGGPSGPRVDSSWISEDGLKIAFDSNGNFDPAIGNADGNFEIFLFNDSTGSFEQVTQTSQGIFESNKFATISADTRVILFMSDRNLDPSVGNADGNRELFLAKRPNQAPVLDPIGPKAVNEGQPLSFSVSATDPNTTDTLTLSATNLPLGASFPTVNGTGSVSGTFTWTPSFIQAGSYQVTFTVTDSSLTDSETITITVNNVNPPPLPQILDPDVDDNGLVDLFIDIFGIAGAFGKTCGDPGFNPSYDLDANCLIDLFIDIFGAASAFGTYQWPPLNSAAQPLVLSLGQTLSVYVTATRDTDGNLPESFSVECHPEGSPGSDCAPNTIGWTLDGVPPELPTKRRGHLEWTSQQSGTYRLTFRATYGTQSSTQTLYLQVGSAGAAGLDLNTLISSEYSSQAWPVLAPIGNQTVVVSGKLLFTVSASDPQPDDVLKLTATLEDGQALSTLGATFTDQGNKTGTFSWTPTATHLGKQYRVLFTATDPVGLRDTETITITVTNPPLAITKLEDRGPGGVLDAPFNPSLGQTTTIAAAFNEAVTSWTLAIKNAAGTVVRKFSYSGAGVSSLAQVWNGTTATGVRVAAGTYTYTLSATAPYSGGSAAKSGTVTVQ